MLPVIAIVGRPNVGKSTLFNRLVGGRRAIVHDRPGVTRDRHYETTTRWTDRELMIVDTGGLEPEADTDLFRSMRSQAMQAVEEADVVLFLVDARAGLTPLDRTVAQVLRQQSTPVMTVVNKVDGPVQEAEAVDFHALGADALHMISSEHGRGVGDLMEEVLGRLPPEEQWDEDLDEDEAGEIRIAVIGRPNVGKSTLVNRLLGEERQVVHDMPGTTLDAVDSVLEVEGKRYVLVDTAGVRRKARIDDRVEGFAVSRAIRTIERCHISLLVIDGSEGPTDQDARLAALVIDRGRGLVVLVNKWDLVRGDPERNVKVLEHELLRRLPHATWAQKVYMTALTGKGVHRILGEVERAYAQFDKRLSTSVCNDFLSQAVLAHSPPQSHRRPVRLNFMMQIRVRPPTFAIFSNNPDGVAEPYKRFLINRLRDQHGFEGTPIRLHFKKKRKAGGFPG